MGFIDILLADNHILIREGIRALLADNSDFNIVGEAAHAGELLHMVRILRPQVVIMDYDLPGFFSTDDIKKIYTSYSGIHVLVVSANQNKVDILRAVDAGVNNYILKSCGKEEFLSAVYATARNEKFFCGKVIDAILDKHSTKYNNCEPVNLSPREVEIVQLITQGLTNSEIASHLFLSIHTVSTHRKNIFKKLDLNNISDLIMYALRTGIIEAPEI